MDTDSLSLAVATPSLELAIKPDMREDFKKDANKWLLQEACKKHQEQFFQLRI
jgi:hypothetical protein